MALYSKNPATEALWGQVCGFAGRQRDARWLVMPKAYIDDSGREDHSAVFVLAGWAAPVETWIPFSIDWQRVLDINPPMQYFKSYEAIHSAGEFKFFSEDRRNQRVRLLCDVLDKHMPVQIHCVIVLSDFEKFIKTTNAPKWMHNPYFIAFWMVISAFVQKQEELGFEEAVDFIFDDQAEKDKIRKGWDKFIALAPEQIKKFIGMEPAFLNDKKVKQLQAADLLAWHTREWNHGIITGDAEKIFNVSLPIFQNTFKGLRIYLDEKNLKSIFGSLVKGAS